MLKICYAEEFDRDFIRWTKHLLGPFLSDGRIKVVQKWRRPDLMLASIWRPHRFPHQVPVVLVSNESWHLYPPQVPLNCYRAVLGIYPPPPCLWGDQASPKFPFISFPYEAVHFDVPLDRLLERRITRLGAAKRNFCCFVVSNTQGDLAGRRIELFGEVNEYRRVDSAGSVLNNTGYRAPRDAAFLDWIAQYKFMISVENSNVPGYVTEKALQASLAGTVPIYLGGGRELFNKEAIVDVSASDYLSEIKRLDHDPIDYAHVQRRELYCAQPTLRQFEEAFAREFLH